MQKNEEWKAKLIELAEEIAGHGFGTMTFSATTTSGDRTKIIINAGRSYVFLSKSEIPMRMHVK